jgi:hypothetical protein
MVSNVAHSLKLQRLAAGSYFVEGTTMVLSRMVGKNHGMWGAINMSWLQPHLALETSWLEQYSLELVPFPTLRELLEVIEACAEMHPMPCAAPRQRERLLRTRYGYSLCAGTVHVTRAPSAPAHSRWVVTRPGCEHQSRFSRLQDVQEHAAEYSRCRDCIAEAEMMSMGFKPYTGS